MTSKYMVVINNTYKLNIHTFWLQPQYIFNNHTFKFNIHTFLLLQHYMFNSQQTKA